MRRLAVLLIALTLLGCTGQVPTRKTGEKTNANTKAAEIASVRILTYEGDPVVDALISGFYEQNKQIRIEKVIYPISDQQTDPGEMLMAKLRAGEIDLFPNMADTQRLLAENLVLPLDPLIKKTGLDLKPYAALVDPLRIDGKLYMLPTYGFPQVIFYNADMFAAAGLPQPKPGWTWDEFRTAAARLTAGEGESKIWGIASDVGLSSLSSTMLFERAGDQMIDPQAAKELLSFWSTMMQTDRSVIPSPKRSADGTPIMTGIPRQHFQKGQAAMTLTSLSSYSYLIRSAPFKMDIAPIPVAPGAKPGIFFYPSSFGIAAGSPNADAAWQFLAYTLSEAGGVALAKVGSFPLVRTEAVKQAWFERQPTPPRSTEHFFSAELRPYLFSGTDAKASRVNIAMADALRKLMQGDTDQETVYREFMAERERILAGQ